MLIDAHSHLPLDEPLCRGVVDSLDIRVLNICVDSKELGGLDAQRGWYRALRADHPDRFAWCTSFSLDGFTSAGWADRVIHQLDEDFASGEAIACKVWKNVGMDLRDPATGAFVFVDDGRFAPIFAHLERMGRPLLMHIGEPMACWLALDRESPHFGYYSTHPQWHWHGRDDVPSHEQLMAARDRVIERHPRLTVIGAHYGSLESNLDGLARRFERYPNFFVDTSARLGDIALLARRDREAVRGFFVRFADRILWGVDWVLTSPTSTMSPDSREKLAIRLRLQYELEHSFFSTDAELMIDNKPVRGLALDRAVLDRLFRSNAQRVYTGL